MSIGVDTSVVLDIMIATRPRHPDGRRLGNYLIDNRLKVRMSVHGMFEIMCATVNEGMEAVGKKHKMKGTDAVTMANPLRLDTVAIDLDFLSRYFDPSIPYIKAGDLIFISIAKHEAIPLITEDDRMYRVAKGAGVDVYRTDEVLARFGRRLASIRIWA